MKWKNQDRILKDGDILRTKVGNKDHEKYGEYCYGITDGGGFGCNPACIGNAIFMDFTSFDLKEVLELKDNPKKLKEIKKNYNEHGSRWERFWGIDYLEAEK